MLFLTGTIVFAQTAVLYTAVIMLRSELYGFEGLLMCTVSEVCNHSGQNSRSCIICTTSSVSMLLNILTPRDNYGPYPAWL